MTTIETVEKIFALLWTIGAGSITTFRGLPTTPEVDIGSHLGWSKLSAAHDRMVRSWRECMVPVLAGSWGKNEDKWKERVSLKLIGKLCYLMRPGVRELLAALDADDPHQINSVVRELADIVEREARRARTPLERTLDVPANKYGNPNPGRIVIIKDGLVEVTPAPSDPEIFRQFVFERVRTNWQGDHLKPGNIPNYDPSIIAQRPRYYLVSCEGLKLKEVWLRLSQLGLEADDFTSFAALLYPQALEYYLEKAVNASSILAVGPNSIFNGPYSAVIIPNLSIQQGISVRFAWYCGQTFGAYAWVLAYKEEYSIP